MVLPSIGCCSEPPSTPPSHFATPFWPPPVARSAHHCPHPSVSSTPGSVFMVTALQDPTGPPRQSRIPGTRNSAASWNQLHLLPRVEWKQRCQGSTVQSAADLSKNGPPSMPGRRSRSWRRWLRSRRHQLRGAESKPESGVAPCAVAPELNVESEHDVSCCTGTHQTIDPLTHIQSTSTRLELDFLSKFGNLYF